MILEDGTLIEDNWHEDEIEGIGRMIFQNGDYYEGQFSKSKAHGYGLKVDVINGWRLEGYWNEDLPN